ncbi:MAG: hypothetical protein V7731_05490 [Amphritea sp.]
MSDDETMRRAKDLERRIRVYEEMEENNDWRGALQLIDYAVLVMLTLGLVIALYTWAY